MWKEVNVLVLSRQSGESIMIGDDVEIKVLDINSNCVRICITTPASLGVYRSEVNVNGEEIWCQEDETLFIGTEKDIYVQINDVRAEKVRLGITAPKWIPVHRKEVFKAIQEQQASGGYVNMKDLPLKNPGESPKDESGGPGPNEHRPKKGPSDGPSFQVPPTSPRIPNPRFYNPPGHTRSSVG